MDKLKELEKRKEKLDREIQKHKAKLCNDKLESLGLKIGDLVTIKKESRAKNGFISSISLSYGNLFKLDLLAVKKDGTPSKNRVYMYSEVEEYSKVEQ